MSEPFLGQIQIFGFDYPPVNWALCQGQILPLSQNTALFSLLGTHYGGNGQSTFGLPDFRGNAACAVGNGPGLTPRQIGEQFGSEAVSLLSNEMPAHSHGFNLVNQVAAKRHGVPADGDALSAPGTYKPFVGNTTGSGNFSPQMITPAGGSMPHPNMQPYLAMNFCIALQGAFPQRP